METYLRSTAMWYGGLGLLTAQVLRSLALPPKYFRLVVQEVETMGVNFIKRLIVPRVLAALLVFPLLTVLADVLGVLGGMVIMYVERGSDMFAYWNTTTYWVVPRDFLMGVGKSVFFGAIVTLIGCYNGLSTTGGTEGLGRATTATVVHCTMGVIISDFFLTKLMLMIFW